MRKIAVIVLAGVAILSIEFLVGYIMGKNSQLVTVKIKNASEHSIRDAMIEYGAGEGYLIKDIGKDRTQLARFYLKSKSIYRLKVTLDNEKILFSASRNVTPGSLLVEKVSDTLITSER